MGIQDLKNNAISIDMTSADKTSVSTDEKLTIDATSTVNKVDMVSGGRVKADLSALPTVNASETEGVEIHESLAKDILEGEESMFGQYMKEKEEEMNQRMATFDEEQALKEDEAELAELEEDGVGNESEGEIGIDSVNATPTAMTSVLDAPTVDDNDVLSQIKEVAAETATEVEEKETVSSEIDDDIEAPDVEVKVDTVAPTMIEEEVAPENNMDQDETLEKLQKAITEKIKPVSKKLDISSFTVVKKPTADIRSIEEKSVSRVAKWVLPGQNSTVLMKEFNGAELESLRQFSENGNSVPMLTRKWRMIYDHVQSLKATDFTSWLKSVPFVDADHYFFAAFIASYKGANFLPMDCSNTKCTDKTWLTDDMPILDMVKFDDEKAKEKFTKLYQSDDQTTTKGLYCSEIVPITNTIAVGFKEASIYSIFEMASLNDEFKEKHSAVLGLIPYIDAFYEIDIEAGTLTPIGYKVYPENATKSIKSKILKFESVISKLNSDEYGVLTAYVREVRVRETGIRYRYPAVECPTCGTKTEEAIISAEELLFTRYQLGALANTPLK